jgi:hypothetical protein
MQYLIHDLLKLPLEDRLVVIEKLLCSFLPTDNLGQLTNPIEETIKKISKQTT